MPSRLRSLCASISIQDDDGGPGELQPSLRSKHSFKVSQQVKQHLSGVAGQPVLVDRAADALVNLHGQRRILPRSASESGTLAQRSQFVRLSSMSRGMSGAVPALSPARALQLPPAGLPPVASSSRRAQQLSPHGSPTVAAEVVPSAFATTEQQQQQPTEAKQQQPSAARQKLSWTSSRRLLDFRLQTEQAASAKQSQPDDLYDDERLEQRLQRLGLDMLEAEGDGNCQFRSVSQQLTGTQDHHAALRQKAVDHISSQREEYEAFLGEEFEEYLDAMTQDGTWGDELTLRALSDALRVVVHVVTSSQHHWYLQYQPATVDPGAPEVFLTYVAPIHYNSLRRQPLMLRSGLVGSFRRTPSMVTQRPAVAAAADA